MDCDVNLGHARLKGELRAADMVYKRAVLSLSPLTRVVASRVAFRDKGGISWPSRIGIISRVWRAVDDELVYLYVTVSVSLVSGLVLTPPAQAGWISANKLGHVCEYSFPKLAPFLLLIIRAFAMFTPPAPISFRTNVHQPRNSAGTHYRNFQLRFLPCSC